MENTKIEIDGAGEFGCNAKAVAFAGEKDCRILLFFLKRFGDGRNGSDCSRAFRERGDNAGSCAQDVEDDAGGGAEIPLRQRFEFRGGKKYSIFAIVPPVRTTNACAHVMEKILLRVAGV